MSQDLQLFKNLDFGTIRTTYENGTPLFCLKDICDILEIGTPSNVKTRLVDPCIDTIKVGVQTGIKSDGTPAIQMKDMTFISEAGLYQAVFMSRKPNAQKFTLWVTNEVLPMIRKTGGVYMADNLVDEFFRNPQGVVDIMQAYINEKKKVEELTPSANKWDNWISSKNIYTVHQASHILGIKGMGLKNLFKYFRENNFVSDKNLAFRQYQDQGLFRVKEIESVTRFGHKYKRFKTFLTPKGIEYFKERLINEGYTDLDFVGEPEGFISDYVKAA